MLHYEAALAIYGLHMKGDLSLAAEGREHCEAVEIYDQLKTVRELSEGGHDVTVW